MSSFEPYISFSQFILALATTIGILYSVWLSHRTLKEMKADRVFKHKPYLMFPPGPLCTRVTFEERGRAVLGVNPKYAQSILSFLPENGQSVIPKDVTGILMNYGLGTAFSTNITFCAKTMWIGNEKFLIDEMKSKTALYNVSMNTIPATPEHIIPNNNAILHRLPTFIVKDYEKKISRVDGVLTVKYKDVFGNNYSTNQIFRIFTKYTDKEPNVTITYSELAEEESSM